MPKIKYVTKRFGAKALAVIAKANEILTTYGHRPPGVVHGRGQAAAAGPQHGSDPQVPPAAEDVELHVEWKNVGPYDIPARAAGYLLGEPVLLFVVK